MMSGHVELNIINKNQSNKNRVTNVTVICWITLELGFHVYSEKYLSLSCNVDSYPEIEKLYLIYFISYDLIISATFCAP